MNFNITHEANPFSDFAQSIQQTADGGFVVAGTRSDIIGNSAFLIYKLVANGGLAWAKTLGNSMEQAFSIQQTTDGGFVVAAGRYERGSNSYAFLIFKLDANGSLTWAKTLQIPPSYYGTNYTGLALFNPANYQCRISRCWKEFWIFP